MKKSLSIGILLAMFGFSNCEAVEIINAANAKNLTIKSTEEMTTKILNSENGKKAYELLTKIIDENIKKISEGGFYNIYNLNTISTGKLKDVEKILPNKTEFDILKSIVEKELIKKGYKVERGQYDFPGSLNFIIAW
jgi:hypothetical protein